MRVIATCACHEWVVVYDGRPLGDCGRCREQLVIRSDAPDDAVTVCLHDGPCR